MGNRRRTGQRDIGHGFRDKAGQARLEATGQSQMEADGVSGQTQAIIDVAVIEGPDHIGYKDFILRGAVLRVASGQHALDPVGKGLGVISLARVARLDALDIGEAAQIVMEQHAQQGIFLPLGAGGIGFRRGERGGIAHRRAGDQVAHMLLVAAEGADHGGHPQRAGERGPTGQGMPCRLGC